MPFDDQLKRTFFQDAHCGRPKLPLRSRPLKATPDLVSSNSEALSILRQLTSDNVPNDDWFFKLVLEDVSLK